MPAAAWTPEGADGDGGGGSPEAARPEGDKKKGDKPGPVAPLGAYYEFDPATQTLEPAGKSRGRGGGRHRGRREKRKRSSAPSFRPGQRVRVKLTDLNSASRQISFELIE